MVFDRQIKKMFFVFCCAAAGYADSEAWRTFERMVDRDDRRLNFYVEECHYCRHYAQLSQARFQKLWPDQPDAHCFGTTLFFVKYLLERPFMLAHSCAQILEAVASDPEFGETAHSFSMHQHCWYMTQGVREPLELNAEAMQQYFHVLVGRYPCDYAVAALFADPVVLDRATIGEALRRQPNQLIMIGYSSLSESCRRNHCIAVSTCEDKILLFDSNCGLCQFCELGSLGDAICQVLAGCRFRWYTAFSVSSLQNCEGALPWELSHG